MRLRRPQFKLCQDGRAAPFVRVRMAAGPSPVFPWSQSNRRPHSAVNQPNSTSGVRYPILTPYGGNNLVQATMPGISNTMWISTSQLPNLLRHWSLMSTNPTGAPSSFLVRSATFEMAACGTSGTRQEALGAPQEFHVLCPQLTPGTTLRGSFSVMTAKPFSSR